MTSTTTFNGGKAILDQGVADAFDREGYVAEDGTRDMTKLRYRILEIISADKVLDRRERQVKATTRGDLVAQTFPTLAGPDQWSTQPDPALAEAVYKAVATTVWSETKPSADSALQRLVGVNQGNGYVLCRCKIGKDQVAATYVTDNLGCIQEDFIRPDNDSAKRRFEAVTKNREMLVIRQPHNAKRYVAEYSRTMRAAITAGIDRLQLTTAAVVNGDIDADDDDGAEDE